MREDTGLQVSDYQSVVSGSAPASLWSLGSANAWAYSKPRASDGGHPWVLEDAAS